MVSQPTLQAATALLPFRICLIVASLCVPNIAAAQTEIYKCTDADGGLVFSQLPCSPHTSEKPESDERVENAEPVSAKPDLDEADMPQYIQEAEAISADCKKRYRDAIDVIDAEIGREFSPEKGKHYKKRLLELTRKLRQC